MGTLSLTVAVNHRVTYASVVITHFSTLVSTNNSVLTMTPIKPSTLPCTMLILNALHYWLRLGETYQGRKQGTLVGTAIRLNLLLTPPDAKAFITGPPALYVKVGSAITLTCHVKQPLSAPDIGPIYWYRANYMLTPFVSHPNEAAIDMQRISMESKLGVKLQSRLRIANAQLSDSGNYTCMPTTAEAASVMVNVINDENPAAMQKSAASHLQSYCVILLCLVGLSVGWLSSLCSLHSPQHHQRPQQFNKIQPVLKSVDTPKFKHMKGESNSALNIYFYLLYDTWGLAKGEQIYVRTCSFHKIFRYEKR
ncbi:uncharacterized protein LOC128863273 isoform X2 [Anastrepha ludens]|uniref:uncharacterized protein LOC128863273 isoform X2 n=1 Tax=Anastrepha ludens TaxID=28586 RepID=UPI0023B0EF0A|nr:uncharacterized protein LOC128863273 isoform X2 [Anastrepha ludens]